MSERERVRECVCVRERDRERDREIEEEYLERLSKHFFDIFLLFVIIDRYSRQYIGLMRGGGLGSSTIFKKFNEPYAPS